MSESTSNSMIAAVYMDIGARRTAMQLLHALAPEAEEDAYEDLVPLSADKIIIYVLDVLTEKEREKERIRNLPRPTMCVTVEGESRDADH